MTKSQKKRLNKLVDELFDELTERVGEYLNTSDIYFDEPDEAYNYMLKQIKKKL